MSKKQKIEPCPFCSSTELYVSTLLGSTRFYHVVCSDCGATGPVFEEYDSRRIGERNAIELWNKKNTTSNQDLEPQVHI